MNNLIQIVTERIKKLCNLREPPFELPADSFIDKASEDIIYKIFEMWQWIDVKDRMPEIDDRYLVIEDHHYNWIGISTMRHGKFDINITHWMPLPQPPIKD